MKITLDIDQLLSEGSITQAEYEKLSGLAAKSTGSLAFEKSIGSDSIDFVKIINYNKSIGTPLST